MTTKRSHQIEAALKAEIAEAGRLLTDPKVLQEWMTQHRIGRSAMSAATGADYDAVLNKQRAAVQGPQGVGVEAYERLSKPLTPENFPGTPTNWNEWKPQDVLIERLAAALDTTEDFWGDLYWTHLGRAPDAIGLDWHKRDTTKRFIAGINPAELGD